MKRNPRILMFAPFCYPPAGSEAIVTAKLVLAMSDAGWEADVICQPALGHYYPASDGGMLARARHYTFPVAGTWLSRLGKDQRASAHLESLAWALKATRAGLRLLKKKRYDFILSRATPLYAHLPALLNAKQSGVKWIANWSDPLPPVKAPPPYGDGPQAPLPLYLSAYCTAVARHADWHTFPCARLKNYVGLYLPQLREKSSVVPHIFLPSATCNGVHVSDRFSLCHVGSLANRNFFSFLHATEKFCQHTNQSFETISIRFIGTANEALQQAVAASPVLQRIVVVEGPKSYEETQRIMASSAVLVVIEAQCKEGIFFPSKFVDYVQTGRPILAMVPGQGTLADIVRENGGGLAANNGSPETIFDALSKLYWAWEHAKLDDLYSSAHLKVLFEPARILGLYRQIFDEIGGQRRTPCEDPIA